MSFLMVDGFGMERKVDSGAFFPRRQIRRIILWRKFVESWNE
jgi:hypothetical protein